MRIKKRIKLLLIRLKSIKYRNKYKEYKNTKKIIYTLSPGHGNMGDQAIAYASLRFLKENFKEYKIIELELHEIYRYYYAIKSILNEDDVIFMHGGGNMGNLYINEEEPRRFIIEKFNKNKIVSMTQTITFTNDKNGQIEAEKTRKIYNKNRNLLLLAREERSFKTMKEFFPNLKVIKIPDIVFSLEGVLNDDFIGRSGIMTCLRSDKESIWKDKKEQFLNDLKENYNSIFEYDTVVDYEIPVDIRELELNKMWNEFKTHKLVITDRLHGMIFSVITKTPSIVLKSLDHKVIESYKWIEGANYIRLVDNLDFNTINPIIKELLNIEDTDILNLQEEYYVKLAKDIREFING